MRRAKKIAPANPAPAVTPRNRAFPGLQRAAELMELATEAAQSRNLPEFLERFAKRVARMLGADWCAVLLIRGNDVELEGASEIPVDAEEITGKTNHASRGKEVSIVHVRQRAAADETELVVVPVRGSDGEALGAILVHGARPEIVKEEKKLLHALASHAALSLENFRRFSQLERSKQQWVQDIDAISDYIVVHDRAWKILRTNRSLASHLGVPPVALVGEAMSGLRQIAETGSDLPCPFCRDTQRAREEYVAASAERIFLVSTSRAPGVVEEIGRAHV